MTFDPGFFEYLSGRVVSRNKDIKVLSDAELNAIDKILTQKSKGDLRYKLVLAIFHLALQTPYRIGQICHMRTDSIQKALKPREYKWVSNSKVSGGEAIDHIITERTYRLIKNIEEETQEIRDKNCPPKTKKYGSCKLHDPS